MGETSELESVYFELQAMFGATKHAGGLRATRELIELCHVDKGKYVLDVGCGVGMTPCYLAERHGCRVVGVDLRESMIERARERAGREGVEDRVEELADRPRGYKPEKPQGYLHLLPLQELIALSMGIETESETRLNSKKIWSEYENLVNRFGNEFKVLLEAEIDDIAKQSNPEIARIILRMRTGRLKIIPGYDGVYGKLVLGESELQSEKKSYTRLEDYL